MEILPLLIGISIAAVIAVAGVFVWAVRSGQFDDLDTPAVRILTDDDEPPRHDRGHHGVAEEAARSTEDGSPISPIEHPGRPGLPRQQGDPR